MITTVTEIDLKDVPRVARLHGSTARTFRVVAPPRATCEQVLDAEGIPRLGSPWPGWTRTPERRR